MRPACCRNCRRMPCIATPRRLADAHRAAERAYVAAPVFGRPDMAQALELARDNLLGAIARGGADKDWSVLAMEAQHRAGLI